MEVSVWQDVIPLLSDSFVACRFVEGLRELPAAASDSLADGGQGVEGLLAQAGRLLHRCKH